MITRVPRLVPFALAVLLAAPAAAQSIAPRVVRPKAAAADAPPLPALAAPRPAPAPAVSAADEDGPRLPSGPPASWFGDRDWRATSLLGFEFGNGDASYSALKVRLDAERTLETLTPRTTLGLVLSLGMVHASDSKSISVPGGFGLPTVVSLKWSANAFELVPSARLTFAFAPKLWVYGDGGLGIAYTASTGATLAVPGLGTVKAGVSDGTGAVLRLAGGLVFAPTQDLRLGAELIGLDIHFGSGLGSSFSILATASHRL
jgi:hypothetical protein